MTRSRRFPAAILAVSLAALAAAYVAQYGFGLEPCILCLYQRVPYGLAAALAAAALLVPVNGRVRAGLVALCGAAFLANAGIAFYHVGVEQHWWAGTAACAGGAGGGIGTVEELRAALGAPAGPRCDEPQWALFGVTMAGYNVAASLLLGAASLWAARRMGRGS